MGTYRQLTGEESGMASWTVHVTDQQQGGQKEVGMVWEYVKARSSRNPDYRAAVHGEEIPTTFTSVDEAALEVVRKFIETCEDGQYA